ncbi:trans-L-3-hydroxyproline dehydratase-like [Mytilus galloprovincialis]|uniref:trans-L-3-hydroxyproline dehydratase-like n=1 Tax=Mytilus galloprovincialis TaxID=29158 RepID=UPI003F7C520B
MATYVTTEMHTGGEPFRIVEKGYPEIPGDKILDKINYLKKEYDHPRKLIMWEPRGHFDMFGAILVPPNLPEADIGVIFINNEGYSPMCGHGVISLGRYLVDKGLVKNRTIPETVVRIQCPCGLVEARVQYDGKKSGAVSFLSVPSFLYAKDVSVDVPEYGKIVVDISFGGGFFALVPASQFNMNIKSSASKIRAAVGATLEQLRKDYKVAHPDYSDLSYMYAAIITDGKDEYSEEVTANCCVFADRMLDRSPCGSGVTSRIAQQFGRGLIKLGQTRTFESITGATFKAKPVKSVKCGDYDAVIVEVTGNGYYTGTSTFTLEEDDIIGRGFLLS